MKKFIKLLTFILCLTTTAVSAKPKTNSVNTEALENINTSLERLETAITTLTSQNEENSYNQKQTKSETIMVLKDLQIQINDVKEEQSKLSKELNLQKIEIENLKNITSMLNAKSTSTVDIQEQPKADSAPSDLLIHEKEPVDEKKEDGEKPQKQFTDDETFSMAKKTFNAKEYTDSAIQFAANIKAFPDGKNFHNNLLYLGLSMQNLDNKNGACTAFAKIVNSKEEIKAEVKQRAQKEFDKLNCNPTKEHK